MLVVSPLDEDAISGATHSHADAIIVDLASRTSPAHREEARGRAATILGALTERDAELLLWTDAAGIEADLDVCVPGSFAGVVVAPEDASEIQTIDRALTTWEALNNVPSGTITLELVIATAKSVQHVEKMAGASDRIVALAIDEQRLLEELGTAPSDNVDRLLYYRGRVSMAAASAELQAHALGHAEGTIEDRAEAGREAGLRGALCFDASAVEPLNRGFSPSNDEVEAARQILDAMQSAIDGGTGAVAVSQGQMADLANIRGAQATIAWSDAVRVRDDVVVSAS